MKQKDWLNNFIEKNAWVLIITFVGVVVSYTLQGARIEVLAKEIDDVKEIQSIIIDNQKAIIKLQANQNNIADDIIEIKTDIKEINRKL